MWFLLLCCSSPSPSVPGAPAAPAASVITAEKPDCSDYRTCRTACSSGDALACNLVGLFAHDGRAGAQPDRSEAARNYRQACDLGAGIGCYNLSHMLRSGDGMAADIPGADALLSRTHELYKKSCAAGGLTWCTNLAGLVQRGEGRDPDQDQAYNLYADTCERGEPLACLELAYMMREGVTGTPDPAGALALLEKTCAGGSGPACNNLGLMVETDGGDPLPHFRKGCTMDVPMACRNLALRLPESERLPLLRRACDAPIDLDPMACAIAAQTLAETDPRTAGEYLVRACSVGLAEACMPAVQVAAEGHMVLPPGEAMALIERGCKLGDAAACGVLQQMSAPPASP